MCPGIPGPLIEPESKIAGTSRRYRRELVMLVGSQRGRDCVPIAGIGARNLSPQGDKGLSRRYRRDMPRVLWGVKRVIIRFYARRRKPGRGIAERQSAAQVNSPHPLPPSCDRLDAPVKRSLPSPRNSLHRLTPRPAAPPRQIVLATESQRLGSP